jgi:hypothetical protein
MKVTETIQHQDGTTATREFNIPFEKGRTEVAWTLTPTDDEPMAVRILKSGWSDHGKPMYHILTEYGPYEETSYSHLTESQLIERFPEFQEILDNYYQDVVVESKVLWKCPNDGELGKAVRSIMSSKK